MLTVAPLEVEVLHHHLGGGLVSIVILSLASAASYGLAAVLQHRAAVSEPADLSMQAGLLARLAHRPIWLAGCLLDGVGYLFQFLALRRGSLSLVEPILVLSLVFALPVAAHLDRRPVTRSEVVPALAAVVGVGLFLSSARPGVGRPDASAMEWVILSVVVALLCGAMTLGAARGSRPRAALLLAAGSGIAFGYVAAVTERTGHLLDAGVAHTLETGAPYALVVAGVAALLLTQSSFHAGILRLSLPTLTISQPVVAVAIGLGVFGERIDTGWAALVGELLGAALITIGVFALARSPAGAGPGTAAGRSSGDDSPGRPFQEARVKTSASVGPHEAAAAGLGGSARLTSAGPGRPYTAMRKGRLMPERTSYIEGTPNWADVQTTDPEGAKGFYGSLFGWTFDDQSLPGGVVYSLAVKGGGLVTAIAPQPERVAAAGAPAMWNTYLAVDDVDAAATRVIAAGGELLMAPFDVTEAGRMAVAKDPSGVVVELWQAKQHIGATVVNEPGSIIWNELVTDDQAAALPFYKEVVGLEPEDIEMEGDRYTMLKAGGETVGGSTPPPTEGVPNHWHVWFAVEDTRETAARAAELGGRVLLEPRESPIGIIATLGDPQGAVFSVIEPRPPES